MAPGALAQGAQMQALPQVHPKAVPQ